MDEQIVQAGRRDVMAQRLERHAAIARGEGDFLGGIAPGDRRAA